MSTQTTFATGSRGRVTIGQETVYGTAISPSHLVDFTSEGITLTENDLTSQGIRGDRSRHKLIRGNKDVNGDLSFEFAASGYGMILRHTLGDYLKLEDCNGGIHARIIEDSQRDIPAVDDQTAKKAIVLGDETASVFDGTYGIKLVYRDANGDLALSSEYTYDEANLYEVAYIGDDTGDEIENPSTDFTDYTATDVVAIYVRNGDGSSDTPQFNTKGGVLLVGDDRTEYRYFEADTAETMPNGGEAATKIWLDPTDVPPGSVPAAFAAGATVIAKAGIVKDNATFAGASEVKKGTFIVEHDATVYEGVFSHFIQKGLVLPQGLTVEVDRDAAIFVYTGMKIDTLSLEFPTNEIVTGTASFVGKEELSIAKLVSDVVPGATSISVENASHFPSAGEITIGERTSITYTGITAEDANGHRTLTISGGDIDRQHLKGDNVDLLTTTAVASPIEGNVTPLTAFESNLYMDGYYEEVLSGSVDLTNNLNTDKFGLGSFTRFQAPEEQFEVSGSLTVEFDDGKHYKKFIERDFFSLEFRCVSIQEDDEILNTGVFPQAYVFLPKCKFSGATPNVSDNSYITVDAPFMAIYDDEEDTPDVTIILVNGETDDVES